MNLVSTTLKIRSLRAFYLLPFIFAACAHGPRLAPEASDAAHPLAHGAVVYSIPADHPVLKMKLVSLGLNHQHMLHLRMYFFRVGPPAGEYLDPREQSIVLPDSKVSIAPARVRAKIKDKPIVSLIGPAMQVVELLFPIPSGGHEFPHIYLNWKIHYTIDGKPQVAAQTEKYDLNYYNLQDGYRNYSSDPDFPNTEPWMLSEDSEWAGAFGWQWW